MQKYKSVFDKKKSLKESLSFLEVYKVGSEEIMAMIESFIKKFKAPRPEIYKALANLFNTLASEAEEQIKEKNRMRKWKKDF